MTGKPKDLAKDAATDVEEAIDDDAGEGDAAEDWYGGKLEEAVHRAVTDLEAEGWLSGARRVPAPTLVARTLHCLRDTLSKEPTMKTLSQDITWDRVKEAVHRDWEQTKHDLHLPGGHELNQSLTDTVEQALNQQAIPGNNRPNPPTVIGSWSEAELPIGFGYEAHQRFGVDHPAWNHQIERTLRAEWEQRRADSEREWGDVSGWVRHGYEYRPG